MVRSTNSCWRSTVAPLVRGAIRTRLRVAERRAKSLLLLWWVESPHIPLGFCGFRRNMRQRCWRLAWRMSCCYLAYRVLLWRRVRGFVCVNFVPAPRHLRFSH